VKRTIEVRIVKKKDKQTTAESDTEDITLEGKAAIVGHYLDKGVRQIGKVMVSYVFVDTLRQVIVAQATKK
jgi:hypothetical protein